MGVARGRLTVTTRAITFQCLGAGAGPGASAEAGTEAEARAYTR